MTHTPESVAEELRRFVGVIDVMKCHGIQAGKSCTNRESHRRAERLEAFATTLRPFNMYDPERMCLTCQAYWHVELAAQACERYAQLERSFK